MLFSVRAVNLNSEFGLLQVVVFDRSYWGIYKSFPRYGSCFLKRVVVTSN